MWENPAGRCQTGHRLRTRQRRPRHAPRSRLPLPLHRLRPPATPSGLLMPGPDATTAPVGEQAVGGVLLWLRPAARGTAMSPDHEATETPEAPPQAPGNGRGTRDRAVPACESLSACRVPRPLVAPGRRRRKRPHGTDVQRGKRTGARRTPLPPTMPRRADDGLRPCHP